MNTLPSLWSSSLYLSFLNMFLDILDFLVENYRKCRRFLQLWLG